MCIILQKDDIFVVGVRDDCLLHCYSLSTGTAELVRKFGTCQFMWSSCIGVALMSMCTSFL